MIDWILGLVPTYGLWLLGSVTFLACLAVPVPCSVLMPTAGGFIATEDLELWQVIAATLTGAVLGDQIGYRIGRVGGDRLLARLSANPKRAKLITRATDMMARRGAYGFFISLAGAPRRPQGDLCRRGDGCAMAQIHPRRFGGCGDLGQHLSLCRLHLRRQYRSRQRVCHRITGHPGRRGHHGRLRLVADQRQSPRQPNLILNS